jgi:hypothetical protein
MRRRYLLLAATSPLCLASAAFAETTIATTVTTPVTTATAASGAPDDLRVTSTGAVQPTSGTAITLNSDDNVTLEGVVKIADANDATGILVEGGRTGEVKVSGSITIDESTEIKDADGDGDNDGPFATGARRFGVRVTGAAPFNGSIAQTGGTITVEGADSAGVLVESALNGSILSSGSISVSGDRSFGVHTTGPVSGDVAVAGISAQGAGAVALALDGDVGGRLTISNAVAATGYRYTTRPVESAVAKLDADDLLQGGPAVRVRGDVAGGIVLDAPPADLDPNDTDEDDDGVADAQETTGGISSFGAAPALQVGSTDAISIGLAGAGANAYGVLLKGNVAASGVYDGVTGNAIQLGGLGGAVTIAGGVRVGGTVTATAVKADATALRLGAGAATPILWVGGALQAAATATDAVNVRAVQVDSGGQLPAISNSGVITATITGGKGVATAIHDASGTLGLIENTNRIAAGFTPPSGTAVTGQAIAMDLRANTTGVTVRQNASGSTTITPTITGDVLFGSGPSRLELNAGMMDGAAAFGAGADTMAITGGARFTGVLTDAGGGLAVDIANGRLTATNADTVGLSTLRVGSTGELVVTLDPAAARSTRFNVAGAATLESGAKIGIRLASKLTSPATFTLIDAGAGQLTAGTLDQSLLAGTPWLYKAELKLDQPAGDLLADVRRRTAAEAGLDAAESAAYDAVFLNFDRDATLAGAMLAKTDEAGFRRLYDQLLPDYSGGLFHTLAQASEVAGRGIDTEPALMGRDGLRAWTQEIGFVIERDLERSGSYDATGFGIAAGVEAPDTVLGVIGVQASFLTLDVDEKNSGANEFLGGSVFSAGLYWRETLGDLTASLGATGGYASLDSRRTVVDVDAGLNRETNSDWSGGLFTLHGGLSYQADLGPVFVRPQASLDYIWFKEGDRTESGGGEAIDLEIDSRTSSQLAAFVGATLGTRLGFGGEMEWTPELTGGWRQVSGKGPGDTTARFLGGGETFNLESPDLDGGAAVARAAFRGSGSYFDIGVEGGAEFRDEYDAYDARLYARVKF